MVSRAFPRLTDHSLVAKAILIVVSAISILHLLVFFVGEIVDACQKLLKLVD